MARDPRYDILFEPVRIGPVTARNRFYQVPHCNGMGHRSPRGVAAMRGIKAEGGWAVVSTEETEIHYSSEISPYVEGRIWDDRDIPALAMMTEAVHAHGSLAAVELVYNGLHGANLYSRETPMAPAHAVIDTLNPVQARAMDRTDIADFRRWHRNAAIRAKNAGFDIVYCYAGHGMSLPMHFLSRRHNTRTDEYGGSLANRVRLFRELIEEAKDAVGDTCAIAVRLAVDELLGPDGIEAEGEGRETVAMLAELPDLWDVNVSGWDNDSQTARFAEEGFQEPYVAFVKALTSKPVVGVGRFTSPDTMVSQIRRGILDFIGAARPSIADPFLPAKIERGELDDIRECIGCNICVSADNQVVPIRCTQNPTMGEEWRRGWHPETLPALERPERVLVVGSGPAGLEAARVAAKRGCHVILAEATDTLGGRVARESRLPGLASWIRVRDYRIQQLQGMSNVEIYRESALDAEHVLGLSCSRVAVATGSQWRRDGVGRTHGFAVPGLDDGPVVTPDDLLAPGGMEGLPEGEIAVFDDDHYVMGGALAEAIRRTGRPVTLVTPAPVASQWTEHTLEQQRIQRRLLELGVAIRPHRRLQALEADALEIACTFTGRREQIACAALVTVTARLPERTLYDALDARRADWDGAGIADVALIGDALAPALIAAAVFAGHRWGRELDRPVDRDLVPFRRELPAWNEVDGEAPA